MIHRVKAGVEYIDATPTWRGILPVILTVLRDGTEHGQRIAHEQLERMAEAADRWNAHCNTTKEGTDQ